MAKPVQESLSIIKEAQTKVNDQLKDSEHVHQLLEINTLFRRLQTRLEFMGAVTEPEVNNSSKTDMFPPIKKFMGETIVRSSGGDKNDAKPGDDVKERFRQKVQMLHDSLVETTAEVILRAYTSEEDLLVIRGVAKKVKLEGFDTKPINEEFIKAVKEAQMQLADNLKKQQQIDDKTKQGEEKILTQADIDADPDLIKWRAKEGDTLFTRNDGKKILKPVKR